MSNILLIGATGGIGHRLAPLLIAHGHAVTGLHRKPEHADRLRDMGVQPVQGDLIEMSVDELANVMDDCDAIVFSAGAAGSGPERTSAIDGDGPIRTIEAARSRGIRRLYLVSAFPEAGRGGPVKEGFEHYMKEKKRADAAVAASELDWVIVRPGTLLHEDGNGRVNAGLAIEYGTVARGNVARVLAALIDRPEIRREIIEVTDGQTAVPTAIGNLVRD